MQFAHGGKITRRDGFDLWYTTQGFVQLLLEFPHTTIISGMGVACANVEGERMLVPHLFEDRHCLEAVFIYEPRGELGCSLDAV